MVLTLYSIPLSPPARAVLLTIEALGLKVEIKKIDLAKGEHLSQEYRQLNPQHTVPTLVDGDTVIWDSHAIITYLVRKYGKDDSLYPKDFAKRALVDQRLHFDSSVVFICIRQIVRPMLFQGVKTISEENLNNVNEAYDFLNKFLEKYKFAAGDTPTLADISLVSSISSLDSFIPVDKVKYPNVIRWLNSVYALPYYKANLPGVTEFKTFIHSLLN